MSNTSLQDRVRHLDSAVHHGGLRPLSAITMIVMHTTDGDSAMSSINYLNTTSDKTASYHYVIDHDGTIYRMTSPNLVAYHAGDSAWPDPVAGTGDRPNGGRSVNARSVGIAWANKGEALTDAQIESALWLCATYADTVTTDLVLGHREVSPLRKIDPPPKVQDMNEWRALLANYLANA